MEKNNQKTINNYMKKWQKNNEKWIVCESLSNAEIKDKIIELFKTKRKLEDKDIHELSDQLQIDTHQFETIIYSILSDYINKE